MKARHKSWLIFTGIIIGAISYWRVPYPNLELTTINMWLLVGSMSLVGALLLNLLLKQKPGQAGLLISLGVAVSMVMRIVYEITLVDPTSHNLAPFEIIISVLQSLPGALAGAYVAKIIKTLA